MFKYKSIASPEPAKGFVTTEKKMVVPNQSMSLEEILSRFTRGEPLEIGRDGAFDEEGDDDLEKVSHMDLVDKEEYVDKLKQTKKRYDAQEKARAKKAHDEVIKQAAEKLAADKKAEKPAEKKAE